MTRTANVCARTSRNRPGAWRRRRESGRPLLAQTVFLGTLALLFVLPVVGGAYLGHWLDSLQAGYSYRWTMSLLVTGLIVGAHERLSLYPEALNGQAGTSRTRWPFISGRFMSAPRC